MITVSFMGIWEPNSSERLGVGAHRVRAVLHSAGLYGVRYPARESGDHLPMRHIIAILLQNEAGALGRVAGLFSTRGYNIESLSVAPTDDPTVSRVTLVTKGSDPVIQQIVNQLHKLIDVVRVEDMTLGEHLERELALMKLKVPAEHADGVRGCVVRAGGRVLDPAPEGFVVELTASEAEINALIGELAARAELVEVVRSGALGMARSARSLQTRTSR
jgi:acetolactate synthase I/III small subunit